MSVKLGYLLPTRERIMEGLSDTAPILTLAEKAEGLGFDSVWVGDSLLARPRHEPMTLLAGVAGRVGRVELGTAVLLPRLIRLAKDVSFWASASRVIFPTFAPNSPPPGRRLTSALGA